MAAPAIPSPSIRDLGDNVKERLRIRAAEHGRSMEAEVRAIPAEAVGGPEQPTGLFGLSWTDSPPWRVSISNFRPATCPPDPSTWLTDRPRHPRHLGTDAHFAITSGRSLDTRAKPDPPSTWQRTAWTEFCRS